MRRSPPRFTRFARHGLGAAGGSTAADGSMLLGAFEELRRKGGGRRPAVRWSAGLKRWIDALNADGIDNSGRFSPSTRPT